MSFNSEELCQCYVVRIPLVGFNSRKQWGDMI